MSMYSNCKAEIKLSDNIPAEILRFLQGGFKYKKERLPSHEFFNDHRWGCFFEKDEGSNSGQIFKKEGHWLFVLELINSYANCFDYNSFCDWISQYVVANENDVVGQIEPEHDFDARSPDFMVWKNGKLQVVEGEEIIIPCDFPLGGNLLDNPFSIDSDECGGFDSDMLLEAMKDSESLMPETEHVQVISGTVPSIDNIMSQIKQEKRNLLKSNMGLVDENGEVQKIGATNHFPLVLPPGSGTGIFSTLLFHQSFLQRSPKVGIIDIPSTDVKRQDKIVADLKKDCKWLQEEE
ncbi:MAG: hypothetical protein QM504_06795 [Pseudomonadota bacterium]